MPNITYAGERSYAAAQHDQGYDYAEPQGRSFAELVEALGRHKLAIIVTTFLLASLAVLATVLWPASYRSTATVLVQDQEIPQELVRTATTSLVDERIHMISQQIMTRAVMMGIVEKFNLYPSMRRSANNEEIVERMRKDVKLMTISADAKSRDDRRRGTIAFQVAYDSNSPQSAQRVVNELVSLYLNENVRTRQQRAAETSSFLSDEAEKLAAYISEMEAKLADFKARNLGRLPQNSQFNVNVIDRLEQELIRVDREIASAEERRLVQMNQLTRVKDMVPAPVPLPADAIQRGAVFEPPERLRFLNSQLASLRGNYGEDHPDVRRTKREIAAIERESGMPDGSSTKVSADDLEVARTKLKELRDKYSDEHPDVQRQRKEVGALEEAAKSAPRQAAAQAAPRLSSETRAETQMRITLEGQLKAAEGELKSLRNAKRELQVKLATLERRVEQAPAVEKNYQDLLRDYDNATLRYREIKAKQMQASVAESLEKDRKGERFTLIDPPQLPEKPVSPNRPVILALGLLIALGGGLGTGLLRDAFDRSLHGSRQLVRLVHVPVLASIPYVETGREATRSILARLALILGVLLLIAGGLWYVHQSITPLDVLWTNFVRTMGF